MKFKYVGIYAPETNWVENLYHETIVVTNGVAETNSKTSADALLDMGFIPYEDWETQEADRVKADAKAREEREAAYLAEREEIIANAEKTFKHDSNLSDAKREKLDEKAADVEGEKPLVPVVDSEKSVEFNTSPDEDDSNEEVSIDAEGRV